MKIKFCKNYLPRLTAVVLLFTCSLLLPQVALPQDFSLMDNDLQLLEDLILDTIANTEEQQRLLDSLKTSLTESETLIADYESRIHNQELLLQNLQAQLQAMSETYQMQSRLSTGYDQRLKFWRTFTLVGTRQPALAGS